MCFLFRDQNSHEYKHNWDFSVRVLRYVDYARIQIGSGVWRGFQYFQRIKNYQSAGSILVLSTHRYQ